MEPGGRPTAGGGPQKSSWTGAMRKRGYRERLTWNCIVTPRGTVVLKVKLKKDQREGEFCRK